MKMTIELSDALFAAAKATAVRRRTRLKALMVHALKREVGFDERSAGNPAFEVNEHGFPVLKKRQATTVTSGVVYQILEGGVA